MDTRSKSLAGALVLILILIGMLLWGASQSGCSSVQDIVNNKPDPKPQEPDDTHDCSAACQRLQELGCPEGDTLDGVTCVEFCVETQQQGHALNPSCLKNINTCEEVETVCAPTRRP